MNDDKNEVALRLYEQVQDLYKFSFRTALQLIGGYLSGTGLLFAFYVSHPDQKILLLLPAVVGLGLSTVCFIATGFTKNIDEMFCGPMRILYQAVQHENCDFMIPSHMPLTCLLAVFGIASLLVAVQCLYTGEFYPKTLDPAIIGILSSTISIIITIGIIRLKNKKG